MRRASTWPGPTAPLIADIVRVAKQLADASPGARLDPPLTLMLDEVANFARLTDLPAYISAYGGSGIVTFAVIQDLAQLEATYSRDLAAATDLGVVDRFQRHEIPLVALRVTQYDQHAVRCGMRPGEDRGPAGRRPSRPSLLRDQLSDSKNPHRRRRR